MIIISGDASYSCGFVKEQKTEEKKKGNWWEREGGRVGSIDEYDLMKCKCDIYNVYDFVIWFPHTDKSRSITVLTLAHTFLLKSFMF